MCELIYMPDGSSCRCDMFITKQEHMLSMLTRLSVSYPNIMAHPYSLESNLIRDLQGPQGHRTEGLSY